MRRPPLALAHRQHGAALVVGLMLLLVLTVLAVAGMNSAAVEFVMAGNEQYRHNAFQAAETGITQGMLKGAFNPNGLATQTFTGNPNASDNYSSVVNVQLGGIGQSPVMWSGSLTNSSAYHFEIDSTGNSALGGKAENKQGIVVIANKDTTFKPDPGAATTTLD